MLKEEILESFFCNRHTHKIPILFLTECLKAFEEVIKKIREENEDAKLSELFDK